MDIARKLDLWKSSTDSITRHDDEDSAVRKAALAAMRAHMDAEEAAMDARNAERVAALVGDPPPPEED